MKKIKIFLALVGATLLSANALAETEAPSLVNYDVNGDGTVAEGEQAYELKSADDLYWFANYVNQLGDNLKANAILANDIVVNTLEFKDGEIVTDGKNYRVWTPIGNSSYRFQGTFDGNGKTISGLYFDNSDQDCVGLFGWNVGAIKNVGVVESYFKGQGAVGGVCGYNDYGTITNCYNTGKVSGSKYIGGVCGYNQKGTITNCYNTGVVSGGEESQYIGGVCGCNEKGTITNCYNTGEVSGEWYIGGVCGENNGTITNCYNTGKVSGSKHIGGVCEFINGDITNCYYLDSSASVGIGYDVTGEGEATAKTAEEFANGTVAQSLRDGTNGNVWGQYIGVDKSPKLTGVFCPKQIAEGDYAGYYAISNADELYWFAGLVNGKLVGVAQNTSANAVLTANITVNENLLSRLVKDNDGNVTNGDDFKAWDIIGYYNNNNDNVYYAGTFDGNGHTISGLYFNDSNREGAGLIGLTTEGAVIKNVGVIDSYFKGGSSVGGVCGDVGNYCTITNCYNTGEVSGGDGSYHIGGVCGCNYEGTITNCYNTGEVSGSDGVGGVCGVNFQGTITNCYNTGVVSGGEESGSIGGVCGKNNSGTITNCYYLETSANTGIGKGDGEATAKTATQFADGTVAKLLFASNTIWGQNTSTDTVPNFSGKILFKVTLTAENGTAENGLGEYNKKYEIKATSNTGYHFAGWSNGSTEIKDSILVVNDTALVATFEAHSFGNWDTTLVATCTVAGLRTHACACGEVETDTIAKLAHTVVVDSAKTATCTVAGLTEGKHCSVCDSVLVAQQTVAKIAHTVVVDSAKTATCTATGLTEGKHCSVCDSIFVAQQTVPALGHKIETLAGVSPTCTADGLTEGSRCSVCGEVIKAQETIPALGHSFTNYIYNNDATYEADGTETAECNREGCNAIDVRTAEGTKLQTSVGTESAEGVVIYAHHNTIVVENAVEDIFIYNADGRCIEMRESCPSVEIAMQREGIYIVRTGDKTQRVFVAQN